MGAFVDFLKSGGGSFAGSALGTAASFVSSAIGYDRQKSLLRRQQAYQTAEREASQKWQEKMWQAQNDYSTPAAQMARLKAAGLNPDMFYSGSGVHGAASSVPGSTASGAPSVPNPAGQSGLDQAAAFLGKSFSQASIDRNLEKDLEVKDSVKTKNEADATLALEKANTEKTVQAKNSVEIESIRKGMQLTDKEIEVADQKLTNMKEECENLKTLRENLKASTANTNINTEYVRFQLDRSKKFFHEEFERFKTENKILLAKLGYDEKTLAVFEEVMAYEFERMNLVNLNLQNDYRMSERGIAEYDNYVEAMQAFADGKNLNQVQKNHLAAQVYLTMAMLQANSGMAAEQLKDFKNYHRFDKTMDQLTGLLGVFTGAQINFSDGMQQMPQMELSFGPKSLPAQKRLRK